MNEKDDIISIGVEVEIKQAIKATEEFRRHTDKALKAVAKSSERLGKASQKSSEASAEAASKHTAAIEDLAEAYSHQEKQVSNLEATLEELRKLEAASQGETKKAIKSQIQGFEKLLKARQKASDSGGGGSKPKKGGMFFGDLTPAKVNQHLRDAGEALKEPLQAFLSKDAVGLMRGLGSLTGKTLGRGLKASLKMGGKGLMAGGEAMSKKGQALSSVDGGGKGLIAAGKMMGQLGKGLSFLSTLGPILGTLSSAVVGLVKLFLDADSMVKDFNKQIMQSASNVEIFARSGNDAQLAAFNLNDTLDQMREAAFDYSTHLALGISKEEHLAMTNVLTQEGVSLARIQEEAYMANKSVKDLATQLVSTGVAYSRAFGVPLQQIGEFQAEMMTEMGRSLDETRTSFSQMTRAAAESGISANRFFAAIRGISPDLGLFNLRLEDSVTLMGQLGKVMNPRNAQKFMQSIAQGMKGMGRMDKLKMSMFAGTKATTDIVKRDITRKTNNMIQSLAKKTGASAQMLQDQFESKGYAGIKSIIDKLPKEMQGAMAESAIDIELQREQSKKGVFGAAMATSDLGIGGALELKERALTAFSGTRDISKAIGSMGLETVAENLGMNDEEVKQFAKLQIAINGQRDTLKQQLETLQGEERDQFMALLKQQGFATDDEAKLKKQIDEVGYDQIISTMTDQMKQQLGAAEEQKSIDERMEDLAKEQGQMTQGLMQKFEILVDWFMNQFYNLMMDIWEMLGSMFDSFPWNSGKDSGQTRALKKAVLKSQDKNLMEALKKSGGDKFKFRGELLKGGFGKDLSDAIGKAYKPGATESDMAGSRFIQDSISRAFEASVGTDREDRLRRGMSAGKAAKLDESQLGRLKEALEQGVDIAGALDRAQVTADQRRSALHQTAGQIDPHLLPSLVDAVNSVKGTATSEQAKASTKTAGTGTPGGGQAALAQGAPPQEKRTAADVAKQQEKAASVAETTMVQQETANEALSHIATGSDGLHKALRQQGIKIDRGFLKSEVAREMETAMLAALRVALFEYYLYSSLDDRSKVAEAFKRGGGPRRAAEQLGQMVLGNPSQSVESTLPMLQENAQGGVVTGVNGGLAQVRAAAGEGLASIGPGERIVPAGGGGVNVSVAVNGIGGRDLAGLIEGKVVEGIREYKRREKYY